MHPLILLYTAILAVVYVLGRNMMRPGDTGYRDANFKPLKKRPWQTSSRK